MAKKKKKAAIKDVAAELQHDLGQEDQHEDELELEAQEPWAVRQYNDVVNQMTPLIKSNLKRIGDQDANLPEADVRFIRSMMMNEIGMLTALLIKHRHKQPGEEVILKWDILKARPQDAATQTDKDTECVRFVAHTHTQTDQMGETHRICDQRPAKPLDGSVGTDVQVPSEARDACDDRLAGMYDKCKQIATVELSEELQIPAEKLPPTQIKERTVLIFRSHKRKAKRKDKRSKAQLTVSQQ